MEPATSEAERVVRQLCAVAPTMDVEQFRPLFADDVVYHNIPMEPAVGVDAAVAVLAGFFAMCSAARFDIHHLAVSDDHVLTERTDTFTITGTDVPIPVMGIFQVVDSRIRAWRDYFDLAQVTSMFPAGD